MKYLHNASRFEKLVVVIEISNRDACFEAKKKK